MKKKNQSFSEGKAVRALAALAQTARLRIFRALVEAGPDGCAAGELAAHVGSSPTALSFHLKELVHAGLIDSRQRGRFVIYAACFTEMNALLSYLTENCCAESGGPCDTGSVCLPSLSTPKSVSLPTAIPISRKSAK